jgi:hypothetical protein
VSAKRAYKVVVVGMGKRGKSMLSHSKGVPASNSLASALAIRQSLPLPRENSG